MRKTQRLLCVLAVLFLLPVLPGIAESVAPETKPTIVLRSATNKVPEAPDGMTAVENPVYKRWQSDLGIKVEWMFVAESGDYKTKLNMLLSTDNMPDAFWADPTTFQMLQEDDMIQDLTDVFDQYASERSKKFYAQDGGQQAANVTVNGRIYGITSPVGYEDYVGLVAIRTDWLEQLGLSAPKNMEDMWAIAKAFKEADPGGVGNLGIGACKNVLGGVLSNPIGQLLNGYGGYSNIWIEKDGTLVNSSIQPERRVAIAKLAEKFKEGLIDPEFGTKTFDNVIEDALAGRTGIFINDFCAPFRMLNGAKKGQKWGWFPLLDDAGEIAKIQVSAAFTGALVVRKGYDHPEAAVQLVNWFAKYFIDEAEVFGANAVNNFAWPFNILAPIDKNSKIHEAYIEYLKTGVMPVNPELGNDLTNSIQTGERFRKDNDMEGWIMYNVFGPEGTEKEVLASRKAGAYVVDKFTGAPTQSMVICQSILQTMEAVMITSIIQGKEPIEAFDTFVTQWKANGGDNMTAEVNEWYAKHLQDTVKPVK